MSYCGVACGQFRFLRHPQGVDGVFPRQGAVTGAARQQNPQHFPIRAQARGCFAQVIHIVVHSKAGKKFSCRAGRQQRASAPVLTLRNRHMRASTWLSPVDRPTRRKARPRPPLADAEQPVRQQERVPGPSGLSPNQVNVALHLARRTGLSHLGQLRRRGCRCGRSGSPTWMRAGRSCGCRSRRCRGRGRGRRRRCRCCCGRRRRRLGAAGVVGPGSETGADERWSRTGRARRLGGTAGADAGVLAG